MVRTQPTARLSTGGVAPRRQLAQLANATIAEKNAKRPSHKQSQDAIITSLFNEVSQLIDTDLPCVKKNVLPILQTISEGGKLNFAAFKKLPEALQEAIAVVRNYLDMLRTMLHLPDTMKDTRESYKTQLDEFLEEFEDEKEDTIDIVMDEFVKYMMKINANSEAEVQQADNLFKPDKDEKEPAAETREEKEAITELSMQRIVDSLFSKFHAALKEHKGHQKVIQVTEFLQLLNKKEWDMQACTKKFNAIPLEFKQSSCLFADTMRMVALKVRVSELFPFCDQSCTRLELNKYTEYVKCQEEVLVEANEAEHVAQSEEEGKEPKDVDAEKAKQADEDKSRGVKRKLNESEEPQQPHQSHQSHQSQQAVDDLKKLWDAQTIGSFFRHEGMPPLKWDPEEARSKLKNGYMDYLCGRCIKANFNDPRYLKKDASMFSEYDTVAGEGTARAVLGWP